LFFVRCNIGFASGAAEQACEADVAPTAEVGALKAEVRRLTSLVKEKNSALDLAIASIRKGSIKSRHEIFDLNPFMESALKEDGWNEAELDGVGRVSVRPYRNMVLIRLDEGARPLLASLLGQKTVSVFRVAKTRAAL